MRYLKKTFIVLFISLLLMGWSTKEVGFTEGIMPGNILPETDLQDIRFDGNKYVLIQFWASSNPKSRTENVLVHNTISGKNNNNVKLISISFDQSEAIFNGTIIADKLDKSTQYFYPQIKEGSVFEKYKLNSNSGNWLINSDGIIIATNLNREDITNL